jgi:hypothetical protein
MPLRPPLSRAFCEGRLARGRHGQATGLRVVMRRHPVGPPILTNYPDLVAHPECGLSICRRGGSRHFRPRPICSTGLLTATSLPAEMTTTVGDVGRFSRDGGTDGDEDGLCSARDDGGGRQGVATTGRNGGVYRSWQWSRPSAAGIPGRQSGTIPGFDR